VTEERLALSELLDKAGDGDFLRTVAEAALQLLMEADVEGLIGAGRYGERTTWRNGHRDRVLGARQIEPVGRQRRTKTESCPTASGRTRKSWLSPGVMPQLPNYALMERNRGGHLRTPVGGGSGIFRLLRLKRLKSLI
jgi:hypothetical protein